LKNYLKDEDYSSDDSDDSYDDEYDSSDEEEVESSKPEAYSPGKRVVKRPLQIK